MDRGAWHAGVHGITHAHTHTHTHTHAHTHTHTHTHTHCTQERMSNECKTPVISKPSSGEFVARGVDRSSLISMAIKGNPEGVKKAESCRKDDHPPGGVYVAGEWGYSTRDLPFS